MATSSDEMKKKFTFRKYEEGAREDLMDHYDWNEYIWQSSWSHQCPIYIHQTPPCQDSCPAGEDIRGWLDIVRGIDTPPEGMEMEEYAFRRSTDSNPFPSVMGRVCPAPCEDGCNRNEVEDNVGINSVEQFIGDSALEKGFKLADVGEDSGKKVAIIGGGPAGLAAAYQLRRNGHACTVFDDHAELGGMMKYGIPGYRTPRNVLDGEINRITDMGVEIKLNTKVGRDISVEQIEKDYDAILWAIGAQSGRLLPIPGGDAKNCISGVAFLRAFNEDRLKYITGKIVVVGGGDTSIDVASVARRIGKVTTDNDKDNPEQIILDDTAHDDSTGAREGADVVLLSRHALEDMPAAEHELTDATREGVEIIDSVNPVEVIVDENGMATAMKVEKLKWENGKSEGTGEFMEIDCTLIASAIGQVGDFEGFEDLQSDRGFMVPTAKYELEGAKPGNFVAGDIVRPHLLTTAIGHASIASESIHRYLTDTKIKRRPKVDVHHFSLLDELQEHGKLPENRSFGNTIDDGVRGTDDGNYAVHNYEDRSFAEIVTHDELFLGHFDYTPRIVREHKEVSSEDVLQNFEERLVPLSTEQVVDEAKRCMSCGMCFECDNCVVYCPQDAVTKTTKDEYAFGRYVKTDYSKCVGCHVCADVCPTGYIKMGLGG